MGKGCSPGKKTLTFHSCATGKAMRTGGAARQAKQALQGSGKLDEPLQRCFAAAASHNARTHPPFVTRDIQTRSIFLVEF